MENQKFSINISALVRNSIGLPRDDRGYLVTAKMASAFEKTLLFQLTDIEKAVEKEIET